jgi:hypothetical protein
MSDNGAEASKAGRHGGPFSKSPLLDGVDFPVRNSVQVTRGRGTESMDRASAALPVHDGQIGHAACVLRKEEEGHEIQQRQA